MALKNNIEAFLAVVENRSFSQAAESMFVSQSAISQRVKSLENELGISLIEREKGGRNIELTSKGMELVPIAKKWISLIQETMDLKVGKHELSLSIGSPDSLNVHLLTPLYIKLARMENPLNLNIRTQQSLEIYALLESKEVDLGFTFQSIRHKNIEINPIFKERMLVISKNCDMWPTGSIHPSELNPKDEIFLPWSSEILQWHDHWFGSADKPHARVDTASLILNFMDRPCYWAICPISVARSFQKTANNIETHELSEPAPSRVCYMLRHRSPRASSIKSINHFDYHFDNFLQNLDWIS